MANFVLLISFITQQMLTANLGNSDNVFPWKFKYFTLGAMSEIFQLSGENFLRVALCNSPHLYTFITHIMCSYYYLRYVVFG